MNNEFYAQARHGQSVAIPDPCPADMNLLAADTAPLPLWHALLLAAPPLLAALAALGAGPRLSAPAAWRLAHAAALAALAAAGLSLAAVLLGSRGVGLGLRADGLGAAVLLLVAFVGWVIVRYSRPYLNGEPQERAYVRWLMATLAAVAVVLVTNHVLVLALAWTATSLALHRLLTFFGERPAAVVAAHKKFIVSRLADACMLGAVALLYWAFGTLQIDQILQQAARAELPGSAAQAAVLLLTLAALLKCAQLPVHGWLIQVMEAPTPVSALLHAGVVNLGGFVLMRFAPLVSDVPLAQALLVLAGTATAVLAALVMTTRISIKVMLAWSTCAQMGFMLLQCGLGAWEMALLHLLAHSLYKAHAFLAAGGAVRRAMLVQLTPRAAPAGPLALAFGALVGVAMTLAAGSAWTVLSPAHASPTIWVLAGIVALALVPLVQGQAMRLGAWGWPTLAAAAFAVAWAYFGLHLLLVGAVVPAASVSTPAAALLWGVAGAFAGLFLLQSAVAVNPHGRLARRLHPWFYGGLFLDEQFNRMAFAIWPPPAPRAAPAPLPAADMTLADLTPAAPGVRS